MLNLSRSSDGVVWPNRRRPSPRHVVGHVDRFLDVAARLGQHLAHLVRHQLGEVLLLLGSGGARSGRGARRASAPGRGASPRRRSSLRLPRARRPRRSTAGRRRSRRRSPGSCSRRSRRRRRRPTRRRCSSGMSLRRGWPRRRFYSVGLGLEERARDPRAPPVAQLALAAGLAAPLAAVRARAAVDDDGHVRVVLVVLDHLVEELVLELARDHAIDHASDCKDGSRAERSLARPVRRPRPARSRS